MSTGIPMPSRPPSRPSSPDRPPIARIARMSFMAQEAAGLDQVAIEAARRRTRIALFTSTALGSTGHIAASTVASIVGQELLGSPALSGAPGATVVFGAAMGAVALSWVMSKRGRRNGLTIGYLTALVGAVLAGTAVVTRSFPLLLLGTFLIGFGNSSTNLSRYAAAPLSVREVFSQPAVVAAMAALIAGQATMVLIMTMTPLHLTAHNHGLGTVGIVISGHVAGMYALAPISGRITQRIGSLRTIFLGTG